MAEHLHSFT